MRFIKEYTILFLIILFVILMEFITTDITNETLKEMETNIDDLEVSLEDESKIEKAEKVQQTWKNCETKLSYYMEHAELEKITSKIENIKSNIQNDNMEDVREQIDEVKYRMEHVKNKSKTELKNIF